MLQGLEWERLNDYGTLLKEMEPVPDWVAKWYELYSTPFLPTSEEAKARVEQLLPKIVGHLPRKGSSVLDLCCGAGAYLFAIERAGYKVTGLDIQEPLVKEARREAGKRKSRATIVKGDARALKFADGSFDAIVFLGAPTPHFSLEDFDLLAGQAFRVLKPKGRMIAEIGDSIALFLSGTYQRVLYEPSGEKDAISIHTRYDGDGGTFDRLYVDLETNKRFKGSFHVWAPYIADYVMKKAGFVLDTSESVGFRSATRLMTYRKP